MLIENENRNSNNCINDTENERKETSMNPNEVRHINTELGAFRCNQEKRREMLNKIKCLEFAIIELAQYLDTHPSDEKAICLHNKYCKECKEIKDVYQRIYGPLTINYPCNKWRWIEEPWPWEGGKN